MTDSDASAMTLAADVGTVDGSARTKAIKIVGNELNNSIDGGNGNDTLEGSTGDDTLTGGAGSDMFIYSGGNDVITDYTAGDKISVTGEYSYELSDGDLILKFADGNLTIKNAANTPITLNGASRKFTTEGVMTGMGTAITLNSDVTNYAADETVVTINASATDGATVIGNAKSNKFYSSDGADTFVYEHTEQEKITYKVGENDAIETITSTIYSAGSDVIYNYDEGDKISLAPDVELKDAYKKNSDTIIKVDSGAITVKDSANKAITIAQGEEEITFSGDVFSKANTSILPATFANEITLDSGIKNLDASKLMGATKLNGNDSANSLVGGKGADTLDGGSGDNTLTGGAGSDVFVYSGGNDTITDYGIGTDKIITASNYQSYTIDNDDIIFNFDGENSLTVKNGVGKSLNINGVAKVFAADKTFNSNNTTVTLGATTTPFDATEFETLVTIDGSAVTSELEVVGNDKANKIYAGKNGSTLDGGSGNDTLIGGAGADKFVYGVGNDVIDNYGAGDKISLASDVTITDFYKTNADLYIKFSAGSLTVKNTSSVTFEQDGKEFSYSDGKLIGGDSVKLPATFTNEFTLDESAKNLDASKLTGATKLNGNDSANSLVGGKGADTLDGGIGDDTLTGGAGSDVFVYSGGKDTITDYGTSSDKIRAASDYQSYEISGDDIIFNFDGENSLNTSGSDVIYNYGDGDKISLGAASVLKNFYTKNSDVIFRVDSGTITVKNSSDKTITLEHGDKTYIYSNGEMINGETVILPATFNGEYTISDKTNVDASKRTAAIKLTGTNAANSITGGTKNDTLDGGTGNDTLTGGFGNDLFVYSGGKDIITDYGNGSDKISVNSNYTSYAINDKDITFNFADGSLKLEGAADSIITINGVAGKYSNNGTLNSKGTAVTLKSDASTYTADADIVTIDGSQTTNAILIGNAKSN